MRRVGIVPAFCLLLLEGCAALPPSHPPVPPIPAEQVTAPPPSRFALIWQPGHFDWDGFGYRWVGGAWVERAGHGTLWQDGFWRTTPAGALWVPAHWL